MCRSIEPGVCKTPLQSGGRAQLAPTGHRLDVYDSCSKPFLDYPPPEEVSHLILVPFMPGGDCALIRDPSGTLRLPSARLIPGEHYLDACLRIPLDTAGYRLQRFHPFARDGSHLYAWVDGDRYGRGGSRPSVEVDLLVVPPEEAADQLRRAGEADLAALVEEAAHSFRTQSDASYYADNLRLLERAYLAATTVEGGSGFGRDHVA